MQKKQSNNLLAKLASSEDLFLENQKLLTQIFKIMSYSPLNLYNILSQNEELVEKQRYKNFMKYTNLYNHKNSTDNENDNNNDLELQIYDDVNEYFEEKLFSSTGKEVGILEGSIQIKNIPIIKQIISGVHTENGYLASSFFGLVCPIFEQPSDPKEYLPEELKTILLNQNILFSRIEDNLNISEVLKVLKNELKKSVTDKLLFYDYLSKIEILMKGQSILIDLGRNLLSVINELSKSNRDLTFDIIGILLLRNELDLERFSIIIDKKYENFSAICESYILFLNELLAYSILHLGQESADNRTKKFVESNLAILYFRIPIVSLLN